MKAILHTQSGPPEALQLVEVPKSDPAENEVRIKIHGAAVSTSNCNLRDQTFAPAVFQLPTRLQFGVTKPSMSSSACSPTMEE